MSLASLLLCVEEARALLQFGTLPAVIIAGQVGYGEASDVQKVFTCNVELSPGVCRRRF